MKTKLKVGQKVFDVLRQEWGVATCIDDGGSYPVIVDFDFYRQNYTHEGLGIISDSIPRLSLTEWNPWEGTGTFTPIDSEPQPQIGDMVWGWGIEGREFIFAEYKEFKRLKNAPYLVHTVHVQNISLTPPEWILELIKQQTV